MPRFTAARELLAPREDVWRFVADPGHFAEWWPGVAAVQADRRGFAPGARWTVHSGGIPTLFRRSGYSGTLVVREVQPPELFSWHLTGDRLDVELRLQATSPERTRAVLEVSAAWLVPVPRAMPRRALARLHDLCQTGASV